MDSELPADQCPWWRIKERLYLLLLLGYKDSSLRTEVKSAWRSLQPQFNSLTSNLQGQEE